MVAPGTIIFNSYLNSVLVAIIGENMHAAEIAYFVKLKNELDE